MKNRIGRPYPDRLADVLDRQVVLPYLASNHTQQMQGIGIAGVYLQDLPVDRLGLLQVARLDGIAPPGPKLRESLPYNQFSVFSFQWPAFVSGCLTLPRTPG